MRNLLTATIVLFATLLNAQNSVEALIGKAKMSEFNGDYPSAFNHYQEALTVNAQNGNLNLALAQYYHNIGQVDSAFYFLAKAEKFAAEDPAVFAFKGVLHADLNNHFQSIEAYSKAIQLNPNKANYYMQRAFEYSAIGKNELAMNDFGIAWQIDPSQSKAYLNMAMSQGFKQKAQELCNNLNAHNYKFESAIKALFCTI